MKNIILTLCFALGTLTSASSFAAGEKSYTPFGATGWMFQAVIDEMNKQSLKEPSATNPWQYYELSRIEFVQPSLIKVLAFDTNVEGSPLIALHFKVTEIDCGYSACGFEAEWIQ